MKRLVVLALLVLPAAAFAQPWAEGVAEPDRDAAQALFAEANKLFATEAHAPALEKYTRAIALWDHPLIRFNIAVTLVRLDRFLEAAEAMDRALRFNKEPFPTPEQYRQALDYQKLIAGRVGDVEATCTQAGVQVSLDGKPWLSCPGTQKTRVLAGQHALVAEAPGHLTRTSRVVVTGGATAKARIELDRIEGAVRFEYPTRRWIPWSVVAGGAAIGAAGVAVWFSGRNQLDDFELNLARECPEGCNVDERGALRDQRDGAKFKARLGVATMIAGGVAVATGATWAFVFNRPRRVLPTVEASPTGAQIGASWRW
ncbi:MAG TPA: tetratricopeptide repeat protein [Kofleriaceae bacterium]